MLINQKGLVFMAKRNRNDRDIVTDKCWQMPQGGIDSGETPRDAVYREMQEEIGTVNVTMLAESQNWYNYDFPQEVLKKNNMKFKGQTQKWFLFLYLGTDADFDFTTSDEQEFNDFAWTPPDMITEKVVDFKADVYRKVLAEFRPLIEEYVGSKK